MSGGPLGMYGAHLQKLKAHFQSYYMDKAENVNFENLQCLTIAIVFEQIYS